MSRSDEAGGMGGNNNNIVWLLYTGQDVPWDVNHARIDPSVKVIAASAFSSCEQLVEVEICEGVERIEEYAFSGCISLKRFRVPSTVKMIGNSAFSLCSQLVEVEFSEGLELIKSRAFSGCKLLKFMKVPSSVKMIEKESFSRCHQLKSVEISDRIEKIDSSAFQHCFSLRSALVPPETQALQFFGPGCHDLMKLFGSKEKICDALKNRLMDYQSTNCVTTKRITPLRQRH